jgi:hypothetical protein
LRSVSAPRSRKVSTTPQISSDELEGQLGSRSKRESFAASTSCYPAHAISFQPELQNRSLSFEMRFVNMRGISFLLTSRSFVETIPTPLFCFITALIVLEFGFEFPPVILNPKSYFQTFA